MKKISVIVPCYNVEKYISKCIDSIIVNDVDMELILVNDGSKDDTLKIINQYKKKYSKKIIVIDQKNQGVSAARNAGLEIATGEYITFVDSDDTVEPNIYSKMLQKALEGYFDMVTCGVNIIYPDKTVYISSGIEHDCLSKKDVKRVMNSWYAVIWNKIYKREVIKDIRFLKGVWYEDVEFLYRLASNINSIGVLEERLCNYMQRDGSITYTYNNKLYDIIDNFNDLIKFYKEKQLYQSYKNELEYAYVRYAYATFVKRLAKSKNKDEFKKGVNYAINEVKRNFSDYKNNKYLKGFKPKNLYLKYFSKPMSTIVYYAEKDKMN